MSSLAIEHDLDRYCVPAEAGVAVADLSLRLIAADDGATSILCAAADAAVYPDRKRSGVKLPRAVLTQLRALNREGQDTCEVRFAASGGWYSARARLVTSERPGTTPWIIIHFQREPDVLDALRKLTEEFNLTDREREALSGIARGLTSKEVAERMNISASTVKAFVRLIAIKTGARNRAEIVAKLLDSSERPRKERAVGAGGS